MGIIKDRFKEKADSVGADMKEMLKEHGNKKIGEVTLAQVYQGMRGMTGLVTETSLLDAQDGIRFRGYSIPELQEKLPKAPGGSEPLPEGLFYLMLVGELPTEEDVHHLTSVWQRRSHVPNHVFATIEALPVSTHPMTQFVVAIMALQTESQFAKRYAKGMNKKDYWEACFDDSMDLIARLPRIAAYIYRRKYKNGEPVYDYTCGSRRRQRICAYNAFGRVCIKRSLPELCSRHERPCGPFARSCKPGSD
jgi:citrate synthase